MCVYTSIKIWKNLSAAQSIWSVASTSGPWVRIPSPTAFWVFMCVYLAYSVFAYSWISRFPSLIFRTRQLKPDETCFCRLLVTHPSLILQVTAFPKSNNDAGVPRNAIDKKTHAKVDLETPWERARTFRKYIGRLYQINQFGLYSAIWSDCRKNCTNFSSLE